MSYGENEGQKFKMMNFYAVISAEEEFYKWNLLLIAPLQKENHNIFTVVDTQEEPETKIQDPWGHMQALINFDGLSGFIHNSEFVLTPDESDKVSLFDRISQESSDFHRLYRKYANL